MAAIAPNILDSMEHDSKVKLLVTFLEQVLHVERKDIREVLLRETNYSLNTRTLLSGADRTEWDALVTLGNRPVMVDIIISHLQGIYSIESITFCGGWQG